MISTGCMQGCVRDVTGAWGHDLFRRFRFVVMRRLKDMSTLTKDGMLDASGLAYRLLLREESRYGLFIDVGLVEGSSEARQYGSFFMSNHGVLKSQVRCCAFSISYDSEKL